MQANEVKAAILKGELDDNLSDVVSTAKLRMKQLAQNLMHSLKAGDVVRIKDIRPKYLCGLEGTVVKTNQTTVSIKLGPDAGRYSGACNVPNNCLELVESK